MKKLFMAAAMLILPVHASQLSLRTAMQPLYLHGSDESPGIKITEVPFVTSYADPEWRFSAIAHPFIPSTDSSWNHPKDINVVSLYQINVTGTYAKNNRDMEVTIDASKAKIPEGYPFTIDQVIRAAEICVNLMFPPKPEDEGKLLITVLNPEK